MASVSTCCVEGSEALCVSVAVRVETEEGLVRLRDHLLRVRLHAERFVFAILKNETVAADVTVVCVGRRHKLEVGELNADYLSQSVEINETLHAMIAIGLVGERAQEWHTLFCGTVTFQKQLSWCE